MACGVCLGTFERFLIADAEQPSCCCRVGIYIPCWPGGVTGWMTGFVGATQHLRVRAEGRTRGSEAGAFPRCCLCSEWDSRPPAGWAADQGFLLVAPSYAKKSSMAFWVRVFHASVLSALESRCHVLPPEGRCSSSLYTLEEIYLVLFDDVPTWKKKTYHNLHKSN